MTNAPKNSMPLKIPTQGKKQTKDLDLVLFDSSTHKKRVFSPENAKRVTMYVCGPTVYSYAHIGNFRSAVVFDLLFRVLRYKYGANNVVYARNITDIDDKIIKAAQESNVSIESITEKYSEAYHNDAKQLNILPPNIEPHATAYVEKMIFFVKELIENNFAYIADNHVFFAVEKLDGYGSLSGIQQNEVLAGARVKISSHKKNSSDFVLWKPSKEGEPAWESPWGRGRPGWHLECSAMIREELGKTIDIHGGGEDLLFPHHENENAQSAGVHHGAPLARYWIHNAFLNVGADKMSKSLGNVVLLRNLLQQWHGEVLRFALLSAQYRQPFDWTNDLLTQSKQQLDRFYRLIGEAPDIPASTPSRNVLAALYNDLNTPMAIASLHELRERAMRTSGQTRIKTIAALKASGELLGVFTENPTQWFKGTTMSDLSSNEIELLIAQRNEVRKKRDFTTADKIRDHLAHYGIILEDDEMGTTWRRK